MRRKPGTLVPLEVSILDAALELSEQEDGHFHGYAMASHLAEEQAARKLTSYGTLYRALGRLEKAGMLESYWEDPSEAADEGRPRRRFYRITGAGERALAGAREEARVSGAARAGRLRKGLAT